MISYSNLVRDVTNGQSEIHASGSKMEKGGKGTTPMKGKQANKFTILVDFELAGECLSDQYSLVALTKRPCA